MSQNVTNASEEALTPNLKNVEVTVQNKLHYCRKYSGQNSRMENQQSAKTPKVWCFELWFLCIALLLNEIYLPMTFQVSSLKTFWVMLRTTFKNENENEQRAITPKVWCLELCFLLTALLLSEIYLPMKFYVDALHSFKVIIRTKKGRTDWLTQWLTYGQTDGRANYYRPPFGGIKIHNFVRTVILSSFILGFYSLELLHQFYIVSYWEGETTWDEMTGEETTCGRNHCLTYISTNKVRRITD